MEFFKNKNFLFILLLAGAVAASCLLLARQALNIKSAGSSRVHTVNNCGFTIDSLQIQVNNYKFTTAALQAGATGNYTFKRKPVHAKHDVVYTLKGYRGGRPVIDQPIFSNDLGYVPGSFRVRILPGFKVEQF